MKKVRHIDEITHDIIGAAMRIHSDLGPGLLESVYETILGAKLRQLGYKVERQRPIDLRYEDMHFEAAFRIDLLVDDQVVLEIKSVEALSKVHAKQLLTYLKLSARPVGLILNFGEATMKDGIKRIVNDHIDSAHSASPREQKL